MTPSSHRRTALAALLSLLLLAAWAPNAHAATQSTLSGYNEGWFVRSDFGPAQLLQKANQGGADIARVQVQWCGLEQQRDVWNVPAWNAVVNNMHQIVDAGMRPLPYLTNAPSWARPAATQAPTQCGTVGPKSNSPAQTDDNITQWRQLVSTFIGCMRASPSCPATVPLDPTLDSQIQGYEIWNEANLGGHWGPGDGTIDLADVNYFSRMLGASFDASNSSGSTRPIILGGLSFPNTEALGNDRASATNYLRKVYEWFGGQGQQPKFDVIGVHPYGLHLHTTAADATGGVNQIENVRDSHNDDAHIYVTEVGDDSCVADDNGNCTSTMGKQRDNLIAIWNQLDTPVIIIHRLVNQDPDNESERMGVLQITGPLAPKPAYCALATKWGASPPAC